MGRRGNQSCCTTGLLAKAQEDKLLTVSRFGFNDRNVFVIINTVVAISPLPGLSLLIPLALVLLAFGNAYGMITQIMMKIWVNFQFPQVIKTVHSGQQDHLSPLGTAPTWSVALAWEASKNINRVVKHTKHLASHNLQCTRKHEELVIDLSFEKTEANMLAANVYSHSKKWNKKKMPSELSTCFAANEVLIRARDL